MTNYGGCTPNIGERNFLLLHIKVVNPSSFYRFCGVAVDEPIHEINTKRKKVVTK
jgi:hypothetical protein